LFRDFEAVSKIKFWLFDIYRFLKNTCLHMSSLVTVGQINPIWSLSHRVH
jgi:hypothetical protein